jgi:hypothetical protein
MRSSMVAAENVAAIGCALDFDFSDGVASTPLKVARSAWKFGAKRLEMT